MITRDKLEQRIAALEMAEKQRRDSMTTTAAVTDYIAPCYLPLHEDIKAEKHRFYNLPGGRGSCKSSFVSLEIVAGVQSDPTGQSKVVAKEFGVGSSTVDRANRFLEGLDAAESVSSGFKDAVRSGAIKTPQSVVQEIRNIPEAQLPAAVEAIKSGDIDTAKEIIQQSKPEPDGCSKNVPGRAAI